MISVVIIGHHSVEGLEARTASNFFRRGSMLAIGEAWVFYGWIGFAEALVADVYGQSSPHWSVEVSSLTPRSTRSASRVVLASVVVKNRMP